MMTEMVYDLVVSMEKCMIHDKVFCAFGDMLHDTYDNHTDESIYFNVEWLNKVPYGQLCSTFDGQHKDNLDGVFDSVLHRYSKGTLTEGVEIIAY